MSPLLFHLPYFENLVFSFVSWNWKWRFKPEDFKKRSHLFVANKLAGLRRKNRIIFFLLQALFLSLITWQYLVKKSNRFLSSSQKDDFSFSVWLEEGIKKSLLPGLEPGTYRLTAWRSTDWATRDWCLNNFPWDWHWQMSLEY